MIYLFTYHAKGTWMPDRRQGYTTRADGVLPPDPVAAAQYRNRMSGPPAEFTPDIQRLAIEESQVAAGFQSLRLHFVGTDPAHIHILVSWRIQKGWLRVRTALRTSLTRRFNAEINRREWFVDCASRKRVRNRGHFDYLMTEYLPRHTGLNWREGDGYL